MNFPEIIKRAWHVTWRYKVLWILGFFAGATGSGYSSWGTSSYRTSSQDLDRWASPNVAWTEFSTFLDDWAPALIAGAVALFLIGILWLVLSLAAQAGLVWEVDIAEQGGEVSAGDGWNVGFHHWWKVLGIGVVLLLPIVALGLIVLVAVAAAILPVIDSISTAGVSAASGWTAFAALAAIGVVSVPIFIVLGFLLGTMYLLALRYLVIERRRPMEAVRASWQPIRHRFKDVLLMWLITFGLSIAFGFVIALPAVTIGVGIGVMGAMGVWPVALVLGLALFLVLLVVMAAWNTFTSALWTIFFRRLTGREVPMSSIGAAYPPQTEAVYGYPPPSADVSYPAPSNEAQQPPSGAGWVEPHSPDTR